MIQVFLTNLREYNNYRLVGDWLTLSMEEEELKEKFNKLIGNDEYFITDYCDEFGFNFGEYENIFEMNELLQQVEDPKCVSAIMEWQNCSLKQAIEEQNDYEFIENLTAVEYEEELVEECYDLDEKHLGWLANYIKIDYEAMARDDDSIYETKDGLLKIR